MPTSQPSSVDTAKAKPKAKPLTSDELGSTDYFLQEKGFTVGIRVIEKGIDGPCKVFEIKDIVERVMRDCARPPPMPPTSSPRRYRGRHPAVKHAGPHPLGRLTCRAFS